MDELISECNWAHILVCYREHMRTPKQRENTSVCYAEHSTAAWEHLGVLRRTLHSSVGTPRCTMKSTSIIPKKGENTPVCFGEHMCTSQQCENSSVCDGEYMCTAQQREHLGGRWRTPACSTTAWQGNDFIIIMSGECVKQENGNM